MKNINIVKKIITMYKLFMSRLYSNIQPKLYLLLIQIKKIGQQKAKIE